MVVRWVSVQEHIRAEWVRYGEFAPPAASVSGQISGRRGIRGVRSGYGAVPEDLTIVYSVVTLLVSQTLRLGRRERSDNDIGGSQSSLTTSFALETSAAISAAIVASGALLMVASRSRRELQESAVFGARSTRSTSARM